jgi:hypothetical protein
MQANQSRNWVTALALLLLLSACDSGVKSRFDEVAGVDLCALITEAEAEHILGPLTNTSASTVVPGSGIAGDCTWTFTRLNSSESATLSVMMTTRASTVHGPSPASFMAVSQAEVEASLGASPWPLPNLGDKAILFQTRLPEHSELWLLQSDTLLILRMMGGSASQSEQFARALSRELQPKDEGN